MTVRRGIGPACDMTDRRGRDPACYMTDRRRCDPACDMTDFQAAFRFLNAKQEHDTRRCRDTIKIVM